MSRDFGFADQRFGAGPRPRTPGCVGTRGLFARQTLTVPGSPLHTYSQTLKHGLTAEISALPTSVSALDPAPGRRGAWEQGFVRKANPDSSGFASAHLLPNFKNTDWRQRFRLCRPAFRRWTPPPDAGVRGNMVLFARQTLTVPGSPLHTYSQT